MVWIHMSLLKAWSPPRDRAFTRWGLADPSVTGLYLEEDRAALALAVSEMKGSLLLPFIPVMICCLPRLKSSGAHWPGALTMA